MYEPRSEAREFVGASRAEAVAKACAYFGSEESALRLSSPAAGEVYGLAARTVIVAIPADAAQRRSSPSPRGGGARDEGPPRRERGAREGREGRREGGREGRRGEREAGRAPQSREVERSPRPALAEVGSDEPSVGSARSALGEAGQFIQGLIERLQLGGFEISETEDGDLVVVQLRGAAVERLGAGDARALDAIQFLVNQVALRQSESARRIVVDAEGDSGGRENHLERLAERAAQRARETTRAVALDPMNPRDRRVIHVALRDTDGIATMSVGAGRYRQVVVVPEGAPEYEQARNQAEASNHGNG